MFIHHLNCISTCPLGGKLMDGQTRSLVKRGHLACHCLLLEADHGLILVDTGLGLEDVRNPKSRLSGLFLTMVSPDFREEMTAVRQVESLGFNASDVRHIFLTHLDFDHAGGLDDFPHATVHMLQEECDYALKQLTWLDRQRFRPQQWTTKSNWRLYRVNEGEDWFGFSSVSQLEGVPNNIRLIPLPGHTHGHCGVAVKLDDKWLLQAGDAYFHHHEMDLQSPSCTLGLRFYQTLMEKDRQARLNNQQRLRELRRVQGDQVELFCSHDVVEFERLSGRSARVPAHHLRR
ncbi:MBL fold metallo-hydrolase [Vreelandella populi]|uniref:MBL fold metallo-hydrolase n=1 Tax=Vreelandella populi TaxID=2498858 RepID=UPI000F8C9757|nr:MBL fold metallo-hydrolase [Halomonas populi]RUR51642.1 MBL fold metallo-hydrolase [Halomonas populi]